jgi:hypothetical protein
MYIKDLLSSVNLLHRKNAFLFQILKSDIRIEFATSKEWPPNSPDLNLLDYHVWNELKQKGTKKERTVSVPGISAS